MASPMCQNAVSASNKPLTAEECVELVIDTDLTQDQFDRLCRRGVFKDETLHSHRRLSEGFEAYDAKLPTVYYLCEDKPGCAYDPVAYVAQWLDKTYESLDLQAEDPIILARRIDGSPEGAVKKYPMVAECVSAIQDPNCQSPDNCQVFALARCTESTKAEVEHFTDFQERWNQVESFKGHDIVQVVVVDGSAATKAVGLGGSTATCNCFR